MVGRGDRRPPHDGRPRGRGDEHRRAAVSRRRRGRGAQRRAPPQRGQAVGVRSRRRRRQPAHDRLRRAERGRRHARALRAAGCRVARRPGDQAGEDARRREPRHAVLCARARPVGRSQRPDVAAGRCAGGRRPARCARARRTGLHAQAHPQSRALHERVRRGARAVGDLRRGAARTGVRAGPGGDRRPPAGARRSPRPVRSLLGARDPRRRSDGPHARLDAPAPGARRPAQHLGTGRHLELRDARARAASHVFDLDRIEEASKCAGRARASG